MVGNLNNLFDSPIYLKTFYRQTDKSLGLQCPIRNFRNNIFCCSTIMQAEIILSLHCTGPNLPCGLHLVRWLLSLAGIERRAQIAGYTRTQPYNQAAYQNTRLVQYTVDDLLLSFLSVSWTCNLFDYENTSHIF